MILILDIYTSTISFEFIRYLMCRSTKITTSIWVFRNMAEKIGSLGSSIDVHRPGAGRCERPKRRRMLGGCEEKEAPVMAIWMGKDGTILGK